MAWIPSALVLRAHALLHLYASHLLLTHPASLLTQNLILFLTSSMRLSPPSNHTVHFPPSDPTSATAFAALVIAALAISDLAATTLPTFAYDEFWSVMAPVRTVGFMGIAGWVYARGRGVEEEVGGYAGELVNGLVFSWAFVEMSLMFWVFIVLREERRQTAVKIMEARQKKDDML